MSPQHTAALPHDRASWFEVWKATSRFFRAHAFHFAALRHFDLALLRRVIERGDLRWPRKAARWVRGAHVLDIGCGRNLQSYGFLACGAKSYTGLDPTLDLDGLKLKNSRGTWGSFEESELSPRAIMERFSLVKFVTTTIEEFRPARLFDVLVMHNVTEHLMQIDDVFAQLPALLVPDGRIVFSHPNFYAWHGHHMKPRSPKEIDTNDAAQLSVMDWAHVRFDPVAHEWIGRTQNRIRLDELRTVVEKHFHIEQWRDHETGPDEGLSRLTPEISVRYSEFTRRDLTVNFSFVVGRKK